MRSRPEVAAALARPYVERAPGVPVFSYHAATRQLKLQVTGDGNNETWIRAQKGWKSTVRLVGAWQGAVTTRSAASTLIVLPPLAAGESGTATLTFLD